MNRVILHPRAREALLEHVSGAHPRGVCGLLIGVRAVEEARVTRALACPNVAAVDRETSFAISPRAVINVRRALRGTADTVLGFYHSFANAAAVPSTADEGSIRRWPETVWLIAPVLAGETQSMRAWWLDGVEAAVRELEVQTRSAPLRHLVSCPE